MFLFYDTRLKTALTGSFIISIPLLQRTITPFFLPSEFSLRLSALTDADLITMLLMVLTVIIEISLGSPFITQENGHDRLAFLCETDMGGRQVPRTWSEALEILQNNYANSLLIQALADALHYKLVIITVHGVNYLILLVYL